MSNPVVSGLANLDLEQGPATNCISGATSCGSGAAKYNLYPFS